MSKRTVFTTITPLPAGLDRDTVMDTLRNHVEMIDLNPLVIDRFRCPAPGYAATEELDAVWYQLKDKVDYLPGGLASGDVTYNSCFHDLSDGLQTHVYAPLGLEIRGKWTLGGRLPGEPAERAELGLQVPKEGLYLREDVDMKCNFLMTSFVKKTLRKAHSKLVERMMEKAQIRATNAHILGTNKTTQIQGNQNGTINREDSASSSNSHAQSRLNSGDIDRTQGAPAAQGPLPRYYQQVQQPQSHNEPRQAALQNTGRQGSGHDQIGSVHSPAELPHGMVSELPDTSRAEPAELAS